MDGTRGLQGQGRPARCQPKLMRQCGASSTAAVPCHPHQDPGAAMCPVLSVRVPIFSLRTFIDAISRARKPWWVAGPLYFTRIFVIKLRNIFPNRRGTSSRAVAAPHASPRHWSESRAHAPPPRARAGRLMKSNKNAAAARARPRHARMGCRRRARYRHVRAAAGAASKATCGGRGVHKTFF